MSTTRSRVFQIQVHQREKPFANQSDLLSPDVLPVKFKLYKSRAWCTIHEDDDASNDDIFQFISPQDLVTSETIHLRPAMLLSTGNRALIDDLLSSMLVPEDEHPAIFEKILPRLVEANCYSDNTIRPLVVFLIDVTLHARIIRGQHQMSSDEVGTWVTRQSMVTYEAKPIPADESAIENLEKATFDDDNSGGEGPSRAACAVCMEEFETGGDVRRLPCLHLYHGDCIVRWLETSHLCPLCRYAMPPTQ